MKNQKIEITKYILTQLNIPITEQIIRKKLSLWWKNPRDKVKGGLGLTSEGFSALNEAKIKNYHIKFNELLEFDSKTILGLDNFITAPFFINQKEIWIFDEFNAVQLVLFEGNVKKFITAKIRNSSLT